MGKQAVRVKSGWLLQAISMMAFVFLCRAGMVHGQGTIVIDTIRTSEVTATAENPNVYVTSEGAILNSGSTAVDLGTFGGTLTMEATTETSFTDKGKVLGNIFASPTAGKTTTINSYGWTTGEINTRGAELGSNLYFNHYHTSLMMATHAGGVYNGGDGNDHVNIEGETFFQGGIYLGRGTNSLTMGKRVFTGSGGLFTDLGVYGYEKDNPANYGNNTFVFDSNGISVLFSGPGDNQLYISPGDAGGTLYVMDTVGKNIGGKVFDFHGDIYSTIYKEPGTANLPQNFDVSQLNIDTTLYTAEIDGRVNMTVQQGSGTMKEGAEFQVFHFSDPGNVTKNIDFNAGTFELAKFEFNDATNSIILTERTPFYDVASNRTQRNIATFVDGIIDNGQILPRHVDSIFGEVEFSTRQEAVEFFKLIDPSVYMSFAVEGIRTTQYLTFGSVDRMAFLREGYPEFRYRPYRPANGVFMGQSPNKQNASIYARGIGIFHKEDPSDTVAGYRTGSGGIQLGYDKRIASGTAAGITASYVYSDIDLIGAKGDGTTKMFRIGGYLTRKLSRNRFLDMELTYGYHDNQMYKSYYLQGIGGRYIDVGQQAHDISAYVGYGREISLCRHWKMIPTLSTQYIYYHQPYFEETGTASLFRFEDQDINSLNGRVALRLVNDRKIGQVHFGQAFEAGYNLEFADNATLSGGWIDGLDNFFSFARSRGFASSFYGSYKLRVKPTAHSELFTRYVGEGSQGGFFHGLEVGGQWCF